jgi:hypothetical protein
MNEIAGEDRKCQAMTKSGKACAVRPLQGQTLCALHADPGRAQELAKRPRKNGVNLKPEANPPDIPSLETATEIRKFLSQLMADVRRRVVDAKTASTLATLATSQLKAISAAELEQRATELEKKVGDAGPTHARTGLLSTEEWERIFAPDEYNVPPPSQPAPQEGSEGTQPTRGRRTMPEGWTVPELSPSDIEDNYSKPLNRALKMLYDRWKDRPVAVPGRLAVSRCGMTVCRGIFWLSHRRVCRRWKCAIWVRAQY